MKALRTIGYHALGGFLGWGTLACLASVGGAALFGRWDIVLRCAVATVTGIPLCYFWKAWGERP